MYLFSKTLPENVVYLKPLSPLLDGEINLFVNDPTKTDRVSQDGIITGLAKINGLDVGIIYQDFRVNGASISKSNAQRMIAFINLLKEMKLPLFFLLKSLGVRINQGRTIFDDAFSVIPALFELKKEAPVITAALGNTLGINAIFFAQGHYRLAVETSAINLTGPEVHRLFFGDKNLTYNKFAVASHQIKVNNLVHENTSSVEEIFKRLKDIASIISGNLASKTSFQDQYDVSLKNLLNQVGEECQEFFPSRGKDVKIFIAKNGLNKLGVILNPPRQPNNLLTVASIDKTIAAIDLFKTLGLPLVSIIDCPGGDPRQGESDADGLVKMTELVRVMIDYPFNKMGIINGRCFGGSSMFMFPKIFGGAKLLAVQGSQIGIMNENIVRALLLNSPRLLQEWEETYKKETQDLKDLIESGTVQKIIKHEDIKSEILTFLANHQLSVFIKNNSEIKSIELQA